MSCFQLLENFISKQEQLKYTNPCKLTTTKQNCEMIPARPPRWTRHLLKKTLVTLAQFPVSSSLQTHLSHCPKFAAHFSISTSSQPSLLPPAFQIHHQNFPLHRRASEVLAGKYGVFRKARRWKVLEVAFVDSLEVHRGGRRRKGNREGVRRRTVRGSDAPLT